MNAGKSIFSQLTEFLPAPEFHQCVARYQGDYKLQSFSCWDQFLCMSAASVLEPVLLSIAASDVELKLKSGVPNQLRWNEL